MVRMVRADVAGAEKMGWDTLSPTCSVLYGALHDINLCEVHGPYLEAYCFSNRNVRGAERGCELIRGV